MRPSSAQFPNLAARILLLLIAGFVGVGAGLLIMNQPGEAPTPKLPTIEEAKAALKREPASPYRWVELAESLLEEKRLDEARYCFEKAVEFGPQTPPILFRATNFYILMKETGPALEYTGRILRLTPGYDQLVFRYYDDFIVELDAILRGIGDNQRAAEAYLRHAMTRKDLPAARRVWDHLAAWKPDNSLVSDYAGFLLRSGESPAAAALWASHFNKSTGDYLSPNRVFNGGFESEPTGLALDWRIQAVKGVEVIRDASVRTEGAHSLRVRFPGTQNLAYRHVAQTVSVTPGRYRLTAWLKAQEVTTDQGVFLEVGDAAQARTAQISGTQDWLQYETEFAVPPDRGSITVAVTRTPSRKFDNKIRGTVWVDRVAVVPVN